MARKPASLFLLGLALALAVTGAPVESKTYSCQTIREPTTTPIAGYPKTVNTAGFCRAACESTASCVAYKNVYLTSTSWRCFLWASRTNVLASLCFVPPPPTWTCRGKPKLIWPPSQEYMDNVSYLYDRYQPDPSITLTQYHLRCRSACTQFGAYNGKPCVAYILTADLGCYLLDKLIQYAASGTDANFLATCNYAPVY